MINPFKRRRKLIELCNSWEAEYKDLIISIDESDAPDDVKEKQHCIADILESMISHLRRSPSFRKKEYYELFDIWTDEQDIYKSAIENRQTRLHNIPSFTCADWQGAYNMLETKIEEFHPIAIGAHINLYDISNIIKWYTSHCFCYPKDIFKFIPFTLSTLWRYLRNK